MFTIQKQFHSFGELDELTRVRSNRVFYQSPEISSQPSHGHPLWYRDKFDLKDEATWHEPNDLVQTNFTTKRGRALQVTISCWSNMLMRGSHDCPMHSHPFSLMQIQRTSPEGIRIWKPIWLIMIGQRRNELTITEAYQSYRQRYDVEHLLRFEREGRRGFPRHVQSRCWQTKIIAQCECYSRSRT